MSDKFNRLKQLLAQGATSDECLFYDCNDNVIHIGATEFQSFNLPIESKKLKKLVLVYVQNGDIILKKFLNDFEVAPFDNSLIYFTLSELETSKLSKGKVEAQLKVLLEDNTILISNILKINAIDSIDPSFFNYEESTLESIQCNIKEQQIKAVQFSEIAAGSKDLHICKFIFDSSWDKLDKTALFKDEYNNKIEDVKIENNTCKIPESIIAGPGNIYIGVVGKYLNSTRPTEWSNSIRVVNSCTYVPNDYTNNKGQGGGGGSDVPYATEDTAGIMKLYDMGGPNVDGSITQRAITEGFNSIELQTDIYDDACLVLNVDFEQENN